MSRCSAALIIIAFCGIGIGTGTGCAWGPGMRMDEGAVEDRAEAAGGADAGYYLVQITPKVLQEQQILQAKPKRQTDPLAETAQNYQYRVAPFDVLSVIVWDHPELTIPAGEYRSAEATGFPVTPSGEIFFPHAGTLQVAGKTLSEIRELLTVRLSKVLEKPQLDVKVAAYRGYRVTVTGEVKTPATLFLTDVPTRALDAIHQSQGVTPNADLKHVILSRNGKIHILDLQAVNEEGDLSHNWLLTNGDVLHISDRSANRVYVLGEVKTPSTRLMTNGRMSLAEALSESNWLDAESANAAGVYVIRGEYDKPKVFVLDATSPDSLLLASAFKLQPLDVVFVSTHKLTQWNRVFQQIWPTIQAATTPALYLRGIVPITTVAPAR